MKLIHKETTKSIIGAASEVYQINPRLSALILGYV